MDSRERIRLALSHREPDRVPIGIGSSGSAIHDEVYIALKNYLGITDGVEPFRRGHGDNHYDDRIYTVLGSDIRHVMLNYYRSEHFVQKELGAGGLYDPFVDAWGVTNEINDGMHMYKGNPLAWAASPSDIDQYSWPDPYGDSGLLEGVAERAMYLRDNTNFAISSRSPTAGIFEICWLMRGFENFLTDMMTNKVMAVHLIEQVTDTIIKYYDVLLSEVGEYLDIVETQDDYGTQTNSFFSPVLFRALIKPARTRLNEFIREKAPHAKIYLHSCGSIRNLIPDILDTGVDILNPVQPLATGMETSALKADYGDQVIFYGAIDMQQAMGGSPDDVRYEVEKRIRDLAPAGGYILAPANVVQRDVPLENIFTLIDSAKRFGTYPIRGT